MKTSENSNGASTLKLNLKPVRMEDEPSPKHDLVNQNSKIVNKVTSLG